MRRKNEELMNNIVKFIDEYYFNFGKVPTMREISKSLNVSKTSVCEYINHMKSLGMIENDGSFRGVKTSKINRITSEVSYLPLVGTVACGGPMLAEENIEEYFPIPTKILGSGKHFILRAKGDSMINAGINSGDYVIVRQQNIAEDGQIIVALIDNEATLKRYYVDNQRKQIRLHPENEKLNDMFFDNILIQGIAVKILKDIY